MVTGDDNTPRANPFARALPLAREQRAYRRLREAIDEASAYHGRTLEQLERDKASRRRMTDLARELDAAMCGAIRAGLLKDRDAPADLYSAARKWLSVQRALGRREVLRGARSGLERRVQRPLQPGTLAIYLAATSHLRDAWDPEQGRYRHGTKAALKRLLERERLISPMSRQAFAKLLRKLGF